MAKGGKKGKAKLSKAEKERLKKEEAERKLQEEEEAKLRAEQELREKEERERQEKEERRLFEEKERARHQAEVDELNIKIEDNKRQLELLHEERWKQENWDRFMRCDGRPDPLSVKELNTYINLWKEDISAKAIEEVLEECEVTLEIIGQIQKNIKINVTDEDQNETLTEAVQRLQELIFEKIDFATFQLLKSPLNFIDQDTLNITHTARSKHITVCVWGNTAKNPRVKVVEFPEEGFTLNIPKNLSVADVAVRAIYVEFDFLSEKSPTFYLKQKSKDGACKPEEKKSESRVSIEENAEQDKPGSTSLSGEQARGSSRNVRSKSEDNTLKEEGNRQSESKVENDTEEKDTPALETETLPDMMEIPEGDDDDFLDEDIVDLRSFSPVGPLIYIELLELPPQPKLSKGWILQQTVESKLKRLQYSTSSAPINRTVSSNSNTHGQETPLDESTGGTVQGSNLTTPVGQAFTPILLSLSLPKKAIVFEEPQLARWDETSLQWRVDGFTEQKYNEEESCINFKTSLFGFYAIMQDLYLNMPFQSWELRPIGLNNCIFLISAASIDVEIEMEDERCRVLKPKDRTEIQHILGQWMTVESLIKELRWVGLNVFSDEDGSKYVSICKKDTNLVTSLYQQMALSASAYAYSWSRWNSENNKEDAVVLQATEWLKRAPVDDHNYALYMASTRICCRLKISEYDSEFEETIADNSQMHPDLFHMLQDGSSDEAKSLVQKTSYLFSDCVFKLLQRSNILVYS